MQLCQKCTLESYTSRGEGEKKMRQLIAVLLLLFAGTALAKEKHEYDLKITVLSSQATEAEYRRSWIKGGGRNVTIDVTATASDGNTYELRGNHRSDALLPGTTYSAAHENNGLRVCKLTDGKCQDLEFHVVKVGRTKN
jgi:hypothetical protein